METSAVLEFWWLFIAMFLWDMGIFAEDRKFGVWVRCTHSRFLESLSLPWGADTKTRLELFLQTVDLLPLPILKEISSPLLFVCNWRDTFFSLLALQDIEYCH